MLARSQAQRATRLRWRTRTFLAAFGVSSVGTGLVIPYNAIYIVNARHQGGVAVASFYAVLALAGIAAAPLGGALADRLSPRHPLLTGVAANAVGFALLAFASNIGITLAAAAAIGLGNGFFYSSVDAFLTRLEPGEGAGIAFAARNAVSNAGVGIGAAGAGVILQDGSLGRFQALYIANVLSFVVFGLVASALRMDHVEKGHDDGAARSSYRSLLRNRILVRLLLGYALLVLFGYALFESVIPLFLHTRLGIGTTVIGALIAVNTVSIVVLQLPIARLLANRDRSAALVAAGLVWGVAFLVGLLAGPADGALEVAVVLVFGFLFAIGEVLVAAAFQPFLRSVVAPREFGRSNGLVSLSFSAGFLVGPAVGVAIVRALPPPLAWSLFTAAAVLTSAVFASARRAARTERPAA